MSFLNCLFSKSTEKNHYSYLMNKILISHLISPWMCADSTDYFGSHHLSLLAITIGKSSWQDPVSAQSWWISFFAGYPILACPLNITHDFVLLGWFLRWEVIGHTATVLKDADSRICSKNMQHPSVVPIWFFSPGVPIKSKWCNYTVVLT